MITRVQLNSKTYNVDVYKHMPSIEDNKRYSIKVERLTVPAQSGGLILNQPLFTVERRLTQDTEYLCVENNGPDYADERDLHLESTFTPQNVRTTTELIYQMNSFFRKLLLNLVSSEDDFLAADGVFAVPDIYAPMNLEFTDWFDMQGTEVGLPIERSLEAVYRCDGRIGIKFSAEAIQMFVLHLTAEGKRILGWNNDFMAVDVNNSFNSEYLVENPDEQLHFCDVAQFNIATTIPANPVAIIATFDNSVFNHGHYRHELVLRTSLPMRNYLECDQKSATYKNQLASYRYPSDPIIQEYDGTMYKLLKNVRRNRYLFEQSTRTHNEFLLVGSKLQNFHLQLMQRNYEWSADLDKFIITEEPYPLPKESLWTIQLAVKPLR